MISGSFFHLLNYVSNFLIILGLGFIVSFVWKLIHEKHCLRIKDYIFVCLIIGITIIFAIIHDLITVTISPEYFIFLKRLDKTNLFFEVIQLAVKVSYFPGLLLGIGFLSLNFPKNERLRLTYLQLIKKIIYPLLGAVVGATILGISFYILRNYLPQPMSDLYQRFPKIALVWGIHFGTYLGGFLGSIYCFFMIRRERHNKNKAVLLQN